MHNYIRLQNGKKYFDGEMKKIMVQVGLNIRILHDTKINQLACQILCYQKLDWEPSWS